MRMEALRKKKGENLQKEQKSDEAKLSNKYYPNGQKLSRALITCSPRHIILKDPMTNFNPTRTRP